MTTTHKLWVLPLLIMGLALGCLPVEAQIYIDDIFVGSKPTAGAVNVNLNKIYVANQCGDDPSCSTPAGTISVIDGATYAVQTVQLGAYLPPAGVAVVVVNPVANKIYTRTCANDSTCFGGAGTLAVIDGGTLDVQTVNVGIGYGRLAVNPLTNKIYVANPCGTDPNCAGNGTVTVIDGTTLTTQTVDVGVYPLTIAVNSATNKIYVVNRYGNGPSGSGQGTVTEIDGDTLATQSVDIGYSPGRVAVNTVTNKVYVANSCGNGRCADPGTVTVIDGDTLATQTITVDHGPFEVAVDSPTNKVYVGNSCGTDPACEAGPTVSIIDGSTLLTSDASVCSSPRALVGDIGVNPVTNTIYLPCNGSPGILTALDGATNHTNSIYVGFRPTAAIVNPVTNRIFVPKNSTRDGRVAVIAGGDVALQFGKMTPCRLVDTRDPEGPLGGPAIQGNTTRSFPLLEHPTCNIPPAAAYSLNVTVVPHGRLGYLTIWPTGQPQPLVSTMNSYDGRVKANAAIVSAGDLGAVNVYVTDTSDVIIDIDGYFNAPNQYLYQFYPLAPCRVIDTRGPVGSLGGPYLHGGRNDGSHRDFPVRGSDCIPANANVAAYSLNFTVAPHVSGQRLGYLTVWPQGDQQPVVSTLNNPTATVVANAAIVPAGTDGGISVFAFDDTDMIADINGYFGPPAQGGYSFYPAAPCRAYDSRNNNGQPFRGTRVVNVVGSPCAPPATARGYVFNATVVPDHGHPMGYLTLWPDGQNMPFVSTLNAYDGLVTSNMAIVPNANGSIDAYADGLTHLILDISGYFAP